MRYILVLWCCLTLTPSLATTQEQRRYHEDFDKIPPYWSWIDDYHDAELERVTSNGVVRYKKYKSGNHWSLYTPHATASRPWSVSFRATLYGGDPNAGPGIVFLTGEYIYYCTIGTARTYWVGRQHTPSNTWITLNKYEGTVYNRPCNDINVVGQPNNVTLAYTGSGYVLTINGVEVETIPADDNWKPLQLSLGSVGIVASGISDIAFDSFDLSYIEPPLPIVPDAFVGAKKTWLKEFDIPGGRHPVISPNGRHMYITANGSSGKDDDGFVSEALTDSTWSPVKNMGWPINNTGHNNVISVSQDGNEVFVYGVYTERGEWSSTGFSTSRRTSTGWSVPSAIASFKDNGVSSTREECETADRTVLVVSREIPNDTRGLKDLYVSFKQPDGSYGPITNLGPNINSTGNEGMPFIAADGRTLYFGSGSDSYGWDDIFVSKRLDDTWTNWSKRVNLGPTINTTGWDGYFCIHPSGRWAYMNSSDGYKSGIVRVDLPSDAASRALLPDPVMLVEGRVLNGKTMQPLSVNIVYTNLETGNKIGTAISEPLRGEYSIILNSGRKYGFYAEQAGYFPVSENLDLDSLGSYTVVKRDLILMPIEQGAVIRLNNLFFDTDKWTLRPESIAELQRLVDMLKSNSKMTIQIGGHTDDRGSDSHNKTLSQNRANAVLAHLTSQGIHASRLKAVGYGETVPHVAGVSDEARQQNRRVEFTITSM